MRRKKARGSDIAQDIVVEWNREKYYKRLAERQKIKREKDKQEQEKQWN